jgi:hypothetical protein
MIVIEQHWLLAFGLKLWFKIVIALLNEGLELTFVRAQTQLNNRLL